MSASQIENFKGVPVKSRPGLNLFFSSRPVSIVIYLLVVSLIIYSAYTGAQSMGYNWQWYQLPKYLYVFTDDGFQIGELILGLGYTINISFDLLNATFINFAPCSLLEAALIKGEGNTPSLSGISKITISF